MWSITIADGTARILAATMVWVGVLAVAQEMPDEAFTDPVFARMVASLMRVHAIPELSTNKLDANISAIARQNQHAKTSTVSSFQWATVLKSLVKDGITLQDAFAKYKSHPDVIAYSITAAGASLDGETGLLLDHQKDCTCSSDMCLFL